MKTFILKTDFGTFKNCVLQKDEYAHEGVYIGIEDLEEGYICDCSTWVEGTPFLEENQFFSKEYDGIPAIMKSLVKMGIVKKIEGIKWFQGFGTFQAYELCAGYEEYIGGE